MTKPDDSTAIRFGAFTLIPAVRELVRDGAPVRLGGRAFDILLFLAGRPGAVVSKDVLMQAVWPGRAVEENNLTVHMTALRRVLGEAPDGQAMIRTVPGRGYMFVPGAAQAEPVAPPPPDTVAPPGTSVRLIGRDQALADLRGLLRASRLVTVVGPGGVGKTSLVLQLAVGLTADFPDSVVFVDFSNTADAARVPEAVAATLGGGVGANSAHQRLLAALGGRRILLILDNCEHLIEPIAKLVKAILSAAPHAVILATSREGLFLAGEHIYRLLPLPFPPAPAEVGPEAALGYDAIRLFVERAQAATRFALNDETAPLAATICARLDGIPLAIEMATARLRVLSLTQLADRLHERFRLLGSTARDATPRHRTLRAVIDWSYDLLPDSERSLLCILSVFAGGATLAAVQAVAEHEPGDEWDVLDRLTGLADKSLLTVDLSPEPRFRLPETVRQYAAEKRMENQEILPHARHAAYFADHFTAAAACWPTTPGPGWLQTYAADADNLRAALAWAFGPSGDPPIGLRLASASVPLWWELPDTPLAEAQRWFKAAVAHLGPDTPPEVQGWICFGQSWRDFRFGDLENLQAAQTAAALFRSANTAAGLGAALWRAGSALLTRETADEAEVCLLEACSVLRGLPPGKWLALTLIRLADLRFRQGLYEAALAGYQEGFALSRSIECWIGLVNGGSNMAELLFAQGDAKRALRQLLDLRDELPPAHRTPLMATLTAHLLLANEVTQMRDVAREAIKQGSGIGLTAALAWTIEAVALHAAMAGELATATGLAAYARRVHPSVATRAGARKAVVERLDALLPADLRHMGETQDWDAATAAERALRALDLGATA